MMKLSFLCADNVRKISVASYMCALFRILRSQEIERRHIGLINATHLFALNKTSGKLRRNAIHWPERRNNKLRNAWAIFSGSTN